MSVWIWKLSLLWHPRRDRKVYWRCDVNREWSILITLGTRFVARCYHVFFRRTIDWYSSRDQTRSNRIHSFNTNQCLRLEPIRASFGLRNLVALFIGRGEGESLIVAQNTYVVDWFRGRELNIASKLPFREGGALQPSTPSNRFTITQEQMALGYSLMIAELTCVLSIALSSILALQDKGAEQILAMPSMRSWKNTSVQDATNFESEFWMLTIICVCFYLTIFPITAIGSQFFQTKWGYSTTRAGAADSVMYVMPAVTPFLIGLLADRVGRNPFFLSVASSLVMASHALSALTCINIWILMIALGAGYPITCGSLWPLLALSVTC